MNLWFKGIEGGIRRTMFAGVPGYPSYGFSRGFTFTDVRGCSLMVVGVPVMIPVRLYQMTRWEDLTHIPQFAVAIFAISLVERIQRRELLDNAQ